MATTTYRNFQEMLADGLRSELTRLGSRDPGRNLHNFYMKNDQRRHLHEFFENIDRCRVEYLLPFYDAPFLKLLASGPLDGFLQHRFYHRWLERFPRVIQSVPWQHYPGHLPCPVKLSIPGRAQWDKRRSDLFRGKNKEAFRRCARALVSRDFPSSHLRQSALWAAVVLHALRWRSYAYAFFACNELHEVCSACTAHSESLSFDAN